MHRQTLRMTDAGTELLSYAEQEGTTVKREGDRGGGGGRRRFGPRTYYSYLVRGLAYR